MEKTPLLGTTAEYNLPSGAVRTEPEEGRRIESGSVGRHEWSFGKRGSVMTQEVLGSLPERGSRTGRAVLRWTNASRLMRRKTSTDNVPHRPQQELPKHNPALNSRCGKCQKASRAMRRSPLSKSTRRETRRASSHKVNQIAERQRKRKR